MAWRWINGLITCRCWIKLQLFGWHVYKCLINLPLSKWHFLMQLPFILSGVRRFFLLRSDSFLLSSYSENATLTFVYCVLNAGSRPVSLHFSARVGNFIKRNSFVGSMRYLLYQLMFKYVSQTMNKLTGFFNNKIRCTSSVCLQSKRSWQIFVFFFIVGHLAL